MIYRLNFDKQYLVQNKMADIPQLVLTASSLNV